MDREMTTGTDGLPGSELEAPERIARPSLHEAIVTRVRDMIIEGDLAPGTRIHEGNWATSSASPARRSARR